MADSNIKVAVRLRPSLPSESVMEDGAIRINNEETSIKIRNTLFTFDNVFPPYVSNVQVYETLVSDKMKDLFEGFNVTILAYGSTGSGKTFTMGTASDVQIQKTEDGLIPLGMRAIFKHIESIAKETDVVVKASFFEIYMESVKDLLKKESLFIPGDSKDAKISNMKAVTINNYAEAMQVLKKGTRARTTGVTSKNSRSSRSHAFFVISMVLTDKNTGKSKFSNFQLVDLAGSERAGTDTSGKEFKQGVHINKGLTALGRVIASLSKKDKHIPYRDSVLTRFLTDSFGGNSHTIMVTCVSPAQANVEETLSSLRYSYFAKKITNSVVINRDATDLIEHLKSELERLRKTEKGKNDEELMNKISYLNGRLEEAKQFIEKIQGKVFEFSANIQSLEIKMVSDIFHKPILQVYIEIVRKIKEDFNSFAKENAIAIPIGLGNFRDNNFPPSSEELCSLPFVSPVNEFQQRLKKTIWSVVETLDDLHQLYFIEAEMKNYENLKVLYHFLRVEEVHVESVKKLQDLLNEKEKVSNSSLQPTLKCGKLRALEHEIEQCQHETKLCVLSIEQNNNVSNQYEILKQRLKELKEKQKASFQEQNQNNQDCFQQAVTSEKEMQQPNSKLTEKMQKLEEDVKALMTNLGCCRNVTAYIPHLDAGDESIGYIQNCLKREYNAAFMEYRIKQLEQEIEKELVGNEKSALREIQNENEQPETAASVMFDEFQTRIASCWHNLNLYKNEFCGKLELLSEDAARFLLTHMYIKDIASETANNVMEYRFQKVSHQQNISEADEIRLLKIEIDKLRNEKLNKECFYQKKIMDLNTEWESKTLLLLENTKKKAIRDINKAPSSLPKAMSKEFEDLWTKKESKYEDKCKETEKLKERLKLVEEENRQLRNAQLKLPVLSTRGKRLKQANAQLNQFSMTEAFLSDDEMSFIQESDQDPDYRATPMYKRNQSKLKRKSPEEDAVLTSPKPPKTLSTSGCSCPGVCGTMRCSCKKKKKECSAFCECNKAKCMNAHRSNMDRVGIYH